MTTNIQKWWQPDVYLKYSEYRLARMAIFRAVRKWFDTCDFYEVDTPALQISPGLEVHLQAFATEFHNPLGDDEQMYLHTSPEFTMKKLLVAGLPRIYQICKTYRNEGLSETHQPEFTMLEWYRQGVDYRQIMMDTEEIVRTAAKVCHATVLKHGARTCDPFLPWERLSVVEAFQKYADIDLMKTVPAEPTLEPDPLLLRREAERIGIVCTDEDRWEDIFFRIMLNRIEDKLGDGRPTILYDYPTCLGALARRKPTDPRFVERFEAYVCGVELCNAFSELTDPVEQASRFFYDMDMKEKLYGNRYPIDADFMAALEYGMPACAGNAIGMDRLVMLVTGADDIRHVQWAPVAVG